MAAVIVVVDDLIFLSKILETARLVGVPVKSVSPAQLSQEIRENSDRTVILDLNHRSGTAVEAVKTLKHDPATSQVRIVGFVSHVQADVVRAAREAGCDNIRARSAFSSRTIEGGRLL